MSEYVELRLYTDATNFVLCPNFRTIQFDVKYNDLGSITVEYPLEEAISLGMSDQKMVGVVMGFSNGYVDEVERYILDSTSDDKVVDGQRYRTVGGRSTLVLLEDSIVYPQNWPVTAPSGHAFANATFGTIFRTFVDTAKARGCYPNLIDTSYTGIQTSGGHAWDTTHSQVFTNGATYLSILQDFMGRGLVDARMDGWTLQLYNGPKTTDNGVTYTYELGSAIDIGVVEVRPATNVMDMTVSTSSQESCTAVLIDGEEGTSIERTTNNSAYLTAVGRRRERGSSQGGVADAGVLTILADAELSTYARITTEETVGVHDATMSPFRDFNVADRIWVRFATDQVPVQRRVFQIAVSVDENGARQLGMTLNSIIYDNDIRLQRKIEAYSGSGSNYGSLPVPVGGGTDTIAPNPPTGLQVSSSNFLSNGGIFMGAFLASWLAPTTNTDGSAISDLSGYSLRWKYALDQNTGSPNSVWMPEFPTSDLSLGYSPVNPGAQINVQVKAVDSSGNSSAWSAQVDHTVTNDTTPPPTPSTPTLSAGYPLIPLVWNGLSSTGGAMGDDLRRVEIWRHTASIPDVAPTVGGTPVLAGELVGWFNPGGGTIMVQGYMPIAPGWTERSTYIRIRAVDNASNTSALSTQVVGTSKASDGSVPPAVSGAPTVTQGYSQIFVKWAAVTNRDFVSYEVHMSASSGFTPSSGTLLVSTASTSITTNRLPDGSSMVPGTTYYFKIIARDNDGAAVSASPQGSGSMSLVDTAGVSFTIGQLSGTLQANQLSAGSLSDNLCPNGSFEDWETATKPLLWTQDASGGSPTFVKVTDATRLSGTASPRMTASSGQTCRTYLTSASPIPCVAGQQYYVSFFIKGASAVDNGIGTGFIFYDTSGAATTVNSGLQDLSTVPVRNQRVVTAPTGAVQMVPFIATDVAAATVAVTFDDCEVRKVLGGAMISDASIIAAHIVDGEITNAKIGDLTADKITGGSLMADLAIIGSGGLTTRGVDAGGLPTGAGLDLDATGLFSYDSAGNKRVEMPTDALLPDVFRGNAEIDALTVNNSTVLADTSLPTAKTMRLEGAVANPILAPTVSVVYNTTQFKPTTDGFWGARRGWDSDITAAVPHVYDVRAAQISYWGQVHNYPIVEKFNPDGSYPPTTNGLSGGTPMTGATAGHYDPYTSGTPTEVDITVTGMCVATTAPTKIYWIGWNGYIQRWAIGWQTTDMGNVHATNWDSAYLPAGALSPWPWQCAMGYDVALNQLIIAQSYGGATARVYRINRDSYVAPTLTFTTTESFPYSIGSVLYSSTGFDFGSGQRYVFNAQTLANTDARVYGAPTGTTGVQNTTEQFPLNTNTEGMYWNGTQFISRSTSGLQTKYESAAGNRWTSSADATWYAAYSWRNTTSGAETTRSPYASFTMKKRARASLTGPLRASGTDETRFFLKKTSAPSGAGQMYFQSPASAGAPPTYLVTSAVFSGTVDVSTSTFGGGGTSGVLVSTDSLTAPRIKLSGDGSGRAGPMTWDTNGAINAPHFVRKTSSQTVTNSTTNVADNQLYIVGLEAGDYLFEAYFRYAGQVPGTTGAGSFKWTLVGPAGTSFSISPNGYAPSTTTPTTYQIETVENRPLGTFGTGTTVTASPRGVYHQTTTGSVGLYWSQNVANATGTTLWNESWLRFTRMS